MSKLAREYGVDNQSRSFSPWSHVVAMLHIQIAHSLSLNDVADTLRNHSGVLTTIRNASPPSRNGLSNANRVRDPAMAEALFWVTRAKDNMAYRIVGQHNEPKGNIVSDVLVELETKKAMKHTQS